jgi:MoaA/NifB/PqqE/SkfB family radical SAM enzyme
VNSFGPQVRYASVDATSKCPLRCLPCYYYRADPEGADLPEDRFLENLATWRAATRAECMLWLGGEPFLRPRLVEQGARMFRRNAAFTSGLVPIPDGFDGGVAVSLDGPPEANDALRGPGAFGRVMENLDGGRGQIFHCTLSAANWRSAGRLTALLHRAGAGAILFGLYSPRIREDGGFVLPPEERAAALASVRCLREEYGGFVLNTPASLDLMEAPPGSVSGRCLYRRGEAVALDHRLRVKRPCSYGEGADCAQCGCVALYLRVAAEGGNVESRRVLEALFRRR